MEFDHKIADKTYHFDSRRIQAGDTYICLPGGESYIDDAISKGAVDVIYMDRSQLAAFSSKYFDDPTSRLSVIGVTGTNGKTSISRWINDCLNHLGYKSDVIGTMTHSLTTPESWDIQQIAAHHLQKGGTHLVMEVSSHGIDQGRVLGVHFDLKILSNITQDHLDYHKTFEAYRACKLSFMTDVQIALFPDDFLSENLLAPTQLMGRFNHENMQAVQAALKALGVSDHQIKSVIGSCEPVPGRLEPVDLGQPFRVFVDYAHTPGGLDTVLSSLKSELIDGSKLRVMFGCGGDRDRSKRPKMLQACLAHADVVCITQDNPRTEDPKQILDDILSGLPTDLANFNYHIEEDRSKAIHFIIHSAQAGDIILLAGKGHETGQVFADQTIDFDDRVEARQVIQSLNPTEGSQ